MKYRVFFFFLYQTFFRQTFFYLVDQKIIHTRTEKLRICLVRPQRQEVVNKALFIVKSFSWHCLKRLTLLFLIREIPGSELGPANTFS
jgi:hypothetical protein